MELFLNLCWLSLLVPACLLWRHRNRSCGGDDRTHDGRTKTRTASPLVFVCVLGCALVLLFPVISASDDLHAMRAEMEEFSPGKRTVCQTAGQKACAWHGSGQNLPAVVPAMVSMRLTGEGWHELLIAPLAVPATPSILRASRAPPCSCLG